MDQKTQLPVNPLTLSFKTPGVEGDFRYYHSERLHSQSRIGMLSMMLMFLGVAIFELLLKENGAGGSRPGYLPFAYLGLAVGACIILVLTFIDNLANRQSILVATAVVLGATVIGITSSLDKPFASDAAIQILTLFWVWVLAGLRFPIATLVGSAIVVLQLVLLWLVGYSEDKLFLVSMYSGIVGVSAIFSCFAAYQSEKTSRQIFFEFYRARENQQSQVTADVMQQRTSEVTSQQEGDWAKTLQDLSVELSSIHDMDLMFNKLLSFMGSIIPNDAAAVGLQKEKGMQPVVTTGALLGDSSEGIRNTMWDAGLLKQLDFSKDAMMKETNTGMIDGMMVRRNKNFAYRLDVPVYSQKRLVGVVTMLRQDQGFNEYEIKIASSCVFHAMMALKNARMQQKLASQQSGQAMATNAGVPNVAPGPNTVPLSSAPLSHKLFREKAKPLFEKAVKADRGISFLVVEIDQLTDLFENHGEKVARNVYALVARLLRNGIGFDDLLAYYGKTGFAVMLIDKDIMETQKLAQEVEGKLKQQKLKVAAGEIKVSLSMGISTYTEDAQDFMAILRAADMALFLVRETGGDSIRVNL